MERCEKHGPYSVLCTECDAEIVEANKPTISECNAQQCPDPHLVETFAPLEVTPEASALVKLEGLRLAQYSKGYVDFAKHHAIADKVLCDLLRAKGFERVVIAFEQLHKYYE